MSDDARAAVGGRVVTVNGGVAMMPRVSRGCLLAGLLAVASPLCVFAQGGPEGIPECQLRVRLHDGTILVGVPSLARIPLQTDFAAFQVEVRHIRAIARDGEGRASVTFVNGDRLRGDVDVQAFDMATALGNVSVPMALVRSIAVSRHRTLPAAVEPGLAAYYPFDGDAGNALCGFDPGGTPAGSEYVPGVAGLARAFDGGAEARPVCVTNACGGGPCSVSFWASFDNPGQHNTLISLNAGQSWPEADLWVFLSHGRLALVQARNDLRYRGAPPALRAEFEASRVLDSNTVYHVAYTFSEGTARYHLDGDVYATYEGVPAPVSRAMTIDVGASPLGNRYIYPLKGWIDDLRFYSRALSETEVRELYEAGK